MSFEEWMKEVSRFDRARGARRCSIAFFVLNMALALVLVSHPSYVNSLRRQGKLSTLTSPFLDVKGSLALEITNSSPRRVSAAELSLRRASGTLHPPATYRAQACVHPMTLPGCERSYSRSTFSMDHEMTGECISVHHITSYSGLYI